jgi:hypothetical protein
MISNYIFFEQKKGLLHPDNKVNKIEQLEVGKYTTPRTSEKFRGVSVGLDKDGYFVTTHRAKSKSYPSIDKIPKSVIKFIKSTG